MPGFRPIGTKPIAAVGATYAAGVDYTTSAGRITVGGPLGSFTGTSVGFQTAKAELGVWVQPPNNQLSLSKAEIGVWLLPNGNELRFPKVEIGVWLINASNVRPVLFVVC